MSAFCSARAASLTFTAHLLPRRSSWFASVACVLLGLVARPALAQSVAAGDLHALVVDGSGIVWSVGVNSQGRLGDGTSTHRRERVPLTGLGPVAAVVAGYGHSLALKADGTVWAWGGNGNGQLGDGTTVARFLPVVVPGLAGVTQLAVGPGGEFSLALRSDGTVSAWGRNVYGQLGDGTTTDRWVPTPVTGLTGIVAVSAGTHHALAVKSDGTVWAWGYNSGRLGDGTATNRSTPIQVPGLTGITHIAAGGSHSLARAANGTVYGWGTNSSGQVGDGTLSHRSSPTVVPTAPASIAQLAAGSDYSAARTSAGEVWVWGANSSGQLGDGTTIARSAPVRVTTLSNITHLGAGSAFASAVDANGVVWAWGYNGYGQLGDGALLNRTTPVDTSASNFAWRVAAPVANYGPSTFNTPPAITLSSVTAGATIRYTLDGSTPTEASPVYTTAVTLTGTTTFSARAFKAGQPDSVVTTHLYRLQPPTPTMTPSGGTFGSAQQVSLSTTTSGAVLRYTLDGTDPTSSSALYSGPFTVSMPTTVKAVAFKDGWDASPVRVATFSFNYGTLATPTASLSPGTHVGTQTVSLAGPAGAEVRYTTNGAEPTTTSPLYTQPFQLLASGTLKVKAFHPVYTTSATLTVVYVIKVPLPTVSQPAGTYAPGTTTQVSADPAATLRMTLNGADPAATDTLVASGAAVMLGRYTLKLRAFKAGCDPSDVTSVTYGLSADLTHPWSPLDPITRCWSSRTAP